MTFAQRVTVAWIAGSLALIPTLMVAAWVRDRLAPAARRYWWRATKRHRRLHAWQVVRLQRRQTAEVAAAADNTDELDALLAMEQEIHHWQQERRANRPYNWEAEGDY